MDTPDIFRSKRFWVMALGLLFSILVAYVPQLEAHADILIDSALVIVGLLIGGYSLQDAAAAYSSGKTKYDNKA